MTKPVLHPWVESPEALRATWSAARTISVLSPRYDFEEVYSEALVILVECALPAREPLRTSCMRCGASLAGVRGAAKFCSRRCKEKARDKRKQSGERPVPHGPTSHVGSMHFWPVDQMTNYAVTEIRGRLQNVFLRGRLLEVSAAELPEGRGLYEQAS